MSSRYATFGFWSTILLVSVGACRVLAEEEGSGTVLPAYVPLYNVTVLDGDTIEADLPIPWRRNFRERGRIRANDFDAWETSRRRATVRVTDDEIEKGKRATAALVNLFAGGQPYALFGPFPDGAEDAYGRLTASFYLLDKNGKLIEVGPWMKQRKHTRE